MPPQIFVDTDNSDPRNKLFNGGKTGKSASNAEEKMQKVVKRIIDKAPGFTTTKFDKAKGYAIRLMVSQVEIARHQTKCSLSGSIVRYPPSVTMKGEKGDEMVSTSMTGNASADGNSEDSLLDCVESIAESLVTKSVPIMRRDYAKR
jgi:hypothetical protein